MKLICLLLIISFLSHSLGIPLYFAGLFSKSISIFRLPSFYHFFFGGLPQYFSNHSTFLREYNFVGFNELPSLVCWCNVLYHHRPQRSTFFRRVRWDLTCVRCDVLHLSIISFLEYVSLHTSATTV